MFDLAEVVQEAFVIATERWPRNGYPTHPRAWLVTRASPRAVDRLRRDHALQVKTALLVAPDALDSDTDTTTISDERLELIFT